MNSKILIVEDEAKLREVLCDYFRSKGDLPVEAEDGRQALQLLDENEFDAVLLDIMMPGLDGLMYAVPCEGRTMSRSFFSPLCLPRRISCSAMSWARTIM